MIWRSLRNAPAIADLLADLIQFVANDPEIESRTSAIAIFIGIFLLLGDRTSKLPIQLHV